MNKLAILLLFCFLINGNKDFTVLYSGVHVLHPGIKNVQSNIQYEIVIIPHKSSKKLLFTALQVDEVKMPVKVYNDNEFTDTFIKNDTLSLFANATFTKKHTKNLRGNLYYQKKGKERMQVISGFKIETEQFAY